MKADDQDCNAGSLWEDAIEEIFDSASRPSAKPEPAWLYIARTNPEPIVFWVCVAAAVVPMLIWVLR